MRRLLVRQSNSYSERLSSMIKSKINQFFRRLVFAVFSTLPQDIYFKQYRVSIENLPARHQKARLNAVLRSKRASRGAASVRILTETHRSKMPFQAERIYQNVWSGLALRHRSQALFNLTQCSRRVVT
jgi:hypothetical protein